MPRTMSNVTLLAGMLILSAAAQTRVDLKTQSANVDFRTAPYTKPMKSGASLPATCTQGDLFFITTAVPGANVYGCTATNTWNVQGSGGGPGALTIESNGTTVGTRGIANFVAGFGILNSILDSGTKFNFQQWVDSAAVLTRPGHQSGQTLICRSSGGSGTDYTCAMNPTLTAYTGGMVVHWVPDVTVAGGGTTLNVDILGAKDVMLADGTSTPTSTDIIGGRMYQIWYDAAIGTFRRVQ